MKKIIVLLAEGFEEVEAVTPIDFLRRAGFDVTVLSLKGSTVQGSHGIQIKVDGDFEAFPPEGDALILPGGMPGAAHLAAHSGCVTKVREFHAKGKVVAAICASPALVLEKAAAILDGRRYTCYPGFEKQASGRGNYLPERVVVDQNIITACGPGAAAEFSATIMGAFLNPTEVEAVMGPTLQPGS